MYSRSLNLFYSAETFRCFLNMYEVMESLIEKLPNFVEILRLASRHDAQWERESLTAALHWYSFSLSAKLPPRYSFSTTDLSFLHRTFTFFYPAGQTLLKVTSLHYQRWKAKTFYHSLTEPYTKARRIKP